MNKEFIKYKLRTIARTSSRDEDAIVSFISDLLDGTITEGDLKQEVIADKELYLTSLEASKTRVASELTNLKK